MTIIQTRWRDIPVEQARLCAPGITAEDWNPRRGKPVALQTPPYLKGEDGCAKATDTCNHDTFADSENLYWACTGLAEIGD